MTTAKKTGIFAGIFVCALLVGVMVYSILANRSFHNAFLISNSASLIGFVEDWRKAGKPQGEELEKLLSSYGSFKPFVYTNYVGVAGTNFVCLFAVEDARFGQVGKLAITSDRTIIWLGEKGSSIVSFK